MTASVGRATEVDSAVPDQPRLFHPPGVIRLLTPAEERALSAPHHTDDRTTHMPAGGARCATADAGLNP